MLNKLIFGNLSHRPVRTLLSVLAIAVEVTMILTLVGVSDGTLDSTAQRARGVGADIIIRPPGSSAMSTLSSAPISEKYIPWLMQQPHVALATGTVVQGLSGFDSITGVDFPAFNKMSGGFTYVEGGDPVNDNDMTVVEDYARQHDLKVGSTIDLDNMTWRISGIFESGKLARICVKGSMLQRLMDRVGYVTILYAKLDDPKLAGEVKNEIQAKLPGYPVYTMDELASLYSISNVGMLKDFIYVVIAVAVIVGFIVVFMAMYTAVLERTREIGILKAVGASSGMILNLLLRETLVLAVCGTVVGIVLTYGTQWLMHALPSNLTQETAYAWWPIAGGIAIAGAMLGAAVPAAKAVRQDVTEALSYE